jgi:hypothetical protein
MPDLSQMQIKEVIRPVLDWDLSTTFPILIVILSVRRWAVLLLNPWYVKGEYSGLLSFIVYSHVWYSTLLWYTERALEAALKSSFFCFFCRNFIYIFFDVPATPCRLHKHSTIVLYEKCNTTIDPPEHITITTLEKENDNATFDNGVDSPLAQGSFGEV